MVEEVVPVAPVGTEVVDMMVDINQVVTHLEGLVEMIMAMVVILDTRLVRQLVVVTAVVAVLVVMVG